MPYEIVGMMSSLSLLSPFSPQLLVVVAVIALSLVAALSKICFFAPPKKKIGWSA